MKAGWQVKTLGELCTFVRGPFGGSLKKEIFVNDGFAIYEQSHAIYDQFNDIRYFISEEKFKEMKRFEINPGDLIMSCSGTMGKVAIVPDEIRRGIINQALLRISPDKRVLNFFLKYWMVSADFQNKLLEYAGGAAIQNVASVKILKEITLPLPPLPEQQRIVSILDESFDGIATAKSHAEQNRKNARELFDGLLQSVFSQQGEGWVEKPLGKIAAIISGFSFKSPDFSKNNAINSIKITNVGVKEFVSETDNFLPEEFMRKYSSYSISAGSIVIALTRSIISSGLKVAVVPNEYDGALLNQRVAAITAAENVTVQKYLYAYLGTQRVIDYVKKQVNTLMQPNLSINDLRTLPIPVPPLPEQRSIVARLDALSAETQRLESIYQQKIAALDELKQSLLQKAFAGEL